MKRQTMIHLEAITQVGNNKKRRATTIIIVAVMIPVLLGFAALTIDVGAMYSVRADLQISADAAAMAAVSAYARDPMLQIRLGYGGDGELAATISNGTAEANRVAATNNSFGAHSTSINPADISFGWIDATSSTSAIDTSVVSENFNAVQVTVRRSASSNNGALSLFFAPIFGRLSKDITATAVAILDDRFSGFNTASGVSAHHSHRHSFGFGARSVLVCWR